METRKYRKTADEERVMEMISQEEGWTYSDESMSASYRNALESSITYVAYKGGELCGYSRSLDDFGHYVYVCDLLVRPKHRGKGLGRKLMECIHDDYPGRTVYVMSDVDGYYTKQVYQHAGSIFEVPDSSANHT